MLSDKLWVHLFWIWLSKAEQHGGSAYKGNGACRTLPKANWPDDNICVAWCSVIGSGIPSLSAAYPKMLHPLRPATQIRHHTVVGHYHMAAATQWTIAAMLSLSPECYKACMYPFLIQAHHLHLRSPDVFSTKCCPANVRQVSRSHYCIK